MLEKEQVLLWIIEHGEKLKAGDEYQLRQLLPIILYYMNDIVRNQLNARRVAYIVAQIRVPKLRIRAYPGKFRKLKKMEISCKSQK